MTPPSPSPSPPQRTSGSWNEVTVQLFVMFGLLVAIVALTGFYDNNFFKLYNIRNMCRDAAIWSLFALGQAVVIISGGIDLSVGSLICFLGVVTVMLVGPGIEMGFDLPGSGGKISLGLLQCGFPTAIVLVVLLAMIVGSIHGLLVCYVQLQPFLVTLCSLLVFRGLARVLAGDSTVSIVMDEQPLFLSVGSGMWLGIPLPVYILVGTLIPLGVFMHFTVPGRYLYAIGYNVEAARFSGVRVNLLRTTAYVLCGILTAMAAILQASDIGSVTPSSAALAYEMYGITGAVLGGCALRGGQGSLIGVVIGMAILRVIKSAVIFLGWSTYWTFSVTGLVLLAAVIIDSMVRRRRAGRS